ncbi:polysaccharide (de)acetylase [Lewinella sp. LCG006]|uniref:polysaccharide (de)acetylase n=1 Tax=Lewinella sp. LCG006 TaxID=3231911 RepID=UPI003460B4BA
MKKHIINLRGISVKKKYLVVESDDWGAIRIPDKKTREALLNKDLINANDPFSHYDTLESRDDLEALTSVLKSHKDAVGKPPVITANTVMANPDFEKIAKTNFQTYCYEDFAQTYVQYFPNQNVLGAFKEGINLGLIYPQFHAREHLNVNRWLNRLQNEDKAYLSAFNYKCFAIKDDSIDNDRSNLMATYDYQSQQELLFIKKSIQEGLTLFEKEFGFQSQTTIAPCYVWNEHIESIFNDLGVKHFQSSKFQQYSRPTQKTLVSKWRIMGQVNDLGQTYSIRNVVFEPAFNPEINWVDKAIESIRIAFFWGKPAILSSHRINYVSGLSKDNSTSSLEQLDELLAKVLKKWPEIEFINSAQLAEIIRDV